MHQRLGTAIGDPGCLSIFGRKLARRGEAMQHRLFAEHVTSEYRVRTEGRGRTVDERRVRTLDPACPERAEGTTPARLGRDWFECVVGCAAAVSMHGVERIGAQTKPPGGEKRLKLSEVQIRTRW